MSALVKLGESSSTLLAWDYNAQGATEVCGRRNHGYYGGAVYENGVLRLSEPLPWQDGARVHVTVSSVDSPIIEAYGMMGWTGDAETIERIALHPEFLPEEAS
jgi:predicted DNA-binding antitoxin AbrB/MazE fold protein